MTMNPDNGTPEREAKVAQLLQAAARSERAPASLRAELGAIRARAGARRGLRLPEPALRRPVLRYTGLAATALTAAVVALAVTLGGGAASPSIAQAAALALRGPAAPAPAPDPSAPASLLTARVGDLHFPNWQRAGGWRSVGERTDQLANRTVTTVYYESGRRRLAYSIVSSPTLAGLRTGAEPYASHWEHGRTVVVWEERGHTCVLSAAGISAPRLWRLASLNDASSD
jgi:hypothetical protein